jgi:hypothetical protein
MAFDPIVHFIDPTTGFIHDKDTGHPTGLVPKPVERVNYDDEFPKWVKPHPTFVERDSFNNVAVPCFPQFHIRRHDQEVTVLVHDEEEEALALHGSEGPVNAEHL